MIMEGYSRQTFYSFDPETVMGNRPRVDIDKIKTRGIGSAAFGDWRDDGACKNQDPDLFFPIGSTGPAAEQAEEAKAICNTCDVREQCLEFALASGQDSGIWGGLTEDERKTLRRGR